MAGRVSQQMWDEALRSIISVSQATLKRNMELEARVSELEARVSELEMELSQWKRAQSASQFEASERCNVLLQQFSNQDPLVLCVINGQNTFFNRQLLVQGFVGGQSAAHYLTKFISEYLTSEDNQLAGRLSLLSFWISIYFNKSELVELLVNQNICSREQLEGFLAGFCETSPRFIVVEVGIGEGAVDRKIREFIHTCARLPQTVKTFLAGCHESNALYSGPFSGLKAENLLDKLVILRGDSEEDWSDQTFPIDILSVRELLVQVQHHSSNQQLATSIVQTMGSVLRSSTNGGLVSPRSPPHEGSRYIDPRYPLHKQNPPPCNEHYLMVCSKGAGTCKYSHDYILSSEQLSMLSINAKKAPCNWLKSGLQCPYGEACCWGHVCPSGSDCSHLRKGKCWFKGEGMHDDQALVSSSDYIAHR